MKRNSNTELKPHECKLLAELLARARFPLPKDVFDAWVENLPTDAFELAITQKVESGRQIILMRRPWDDKHWPNMWHMPGTVVRQGDTQWKCYSRVMNTELHPSVSLGTPNHVCTVIFPKGEGKNRCRRGQETALLHHVEFKHECTFDGHWFPIDNLPDGTIPFHRTMIGMVRKYLKV